MRRVINKKQKGSSLVTVVVLSIVAITLLSAMVYISGALLVTSTSWQSSVEAHLAAETGADDALMKVVLNPTMPATPLPTIGLTRATVAEAILTPPAPNQVGTIYSTGTSGFYSKKIKVEYTVDLDGKLTVLSRKDTLE